jgi:hypothetical protein
MNRARRLMTNCDETAALLRELDTIIDSNRFPLAPRILTLKAIRAKLQDQSWCAVREPTPTTRQYEPPSKGRYRRRK